MKCNAILISFISLLFSLCVHSQQLTNKVYTHADTLRGSITPERAWWNLLHYSIAVTPNIEAKTIEGAVTMQFKALKAGKIMQIDLQQPLIIDSITQPIGKKKSKQLPFKRDGNIALIDFEKVVQLNLKYSITIYYHGKPKEAVNPPWEGGISWKKDSNGAPFIATSCQGLGASVWWPCKDHQSDEPDWGVVIAVRVPDTLTNVSNGKLKKIITHNDHTKTWVWEVKNPINNYSVCMNIGKYVLIEDQYNGLGGPLPLNYYFLKDHKDSALVQLKQVKTMLDCFEHWFGKYPFYQDGYKLVEVPYLGMEHQSNVTYGNRFKNGYLGKDISTSGWGMHWDYIIIHESAHEWFGNNITSKDIADMWIHEGFTTYSETLFSEWLDGSIAGDEYNFGSRKRIKNKDPIIGDYNVNAAGSGDMYFKASAMIHSIRKAMNNDEQFKQMLLGLNKEFWHATITTSDVECKMNSYTRFSLGKIFDQYLRKTEIPVLEYYFSVSGNKLMYRWSNAIDEFNLPIVIQTKLKPITIVPKVEKWQELYFPLGMINETQMQSLSKSFYIQLMEKKELVIRSN